MKRSVPKEIPSEVKVSVLKMIVIMRDDCTLIEIKNYRKEVQCKFVFRKHAEIYT